MKKAYYRGIECLFNEDTGEIIGSNEWNDILVDAFLAWDRLFLKKETLSIFIPDEIQEVEEDLTIEFNLEEDEN